MLASRFWALGDTFVGFCSTVECELGLRVRRSCEEYVGKGDGCSTEICVVLVVFVMALLLLEMLLQAIVLVGTVLYLLPYPLHLYYY